MFTEVNLLSERREKKPATNCYDGVVGQQIMNNDDNNIPIRCCMHFRLVERGKKMFFSAENFRKF